MTYTHKEAPVTPRYSDRKQTTCKATVSCDGRVGEGRLVDLTVPGCQLESTLVLEPGQCVQVRLHLDHRTPMCVDLGIVRWTHGGTAGIEFIRMAEDEQLRLRCYVGYVEKRRRSNQSWGEAPMCVGY